MKSNACDWSNSLPQPTTCGTWHQVQRCLVVHSRTMVTDCSQFDVTVKMEEAQLLRAAAQQMSISILCGAGDVKSVASSAPATGNDWCSWVDCKRGHVHTTRLHCADGTISCSAHIPQFDVTNTCQPRVTITEESEPAQSNKNTESRPHVT